jgi:4-hydroxyphenylpyruvate dioxygenase
MKPAISQATTLPSPFDADVTGYAEGGCVALEVWLTKLETLVNAQGVEKTRSLLLQSGVELTSACYQGGLLLSQGEARKAHFDHFRQRLDLCQAFRIPTLILLADFAQKMDAAVLARAMASLAEAGSWAEGYGVRLGLEFRGSDTFCNCLDTAITLVEECGSANVGVCLDLFHYYKGPSKPEDLARLTRRNLAHVQLCDVAGVPREIMSDADRVFPGEGDFQFGPIIRQLRTIGYEGYIALELLNPQIWGSRPSQVAELGMASLTRILTETP